MEAKYMMATITSGGCLVVIAENELEGYALKKWATDAFTGPDVKYGEKHCVRGSQFSLLHNGKVIKDD